jgi:hypothetical protein
MTCRCDIRVYPPPLAIPAGLPDLPRQIAGFPEFRAAMLATVPLHFALRDWRARGDGDFGVMLLEMWAYIADVLAFYDKVIADEAYLRTAKLRPSVRRLTSLLGYVPRPAVGARVRLALLAEGSRATRVPARTAFRSGAFGGQPPQVFETDAEALAHPALNTHAVAPPRQTALGGALSHLLLEPATALAEEGDVALLDLGSAGVHLRRLARVARVTDTDRRTYVRVDLDAAITLPAPTPLSAARLSKPTQKAQLRSPLDTSEQPPFVEAGGVSRLTLDAVYLQIKTGDRVLVSRGTDCRWSNVVERAEAAFTVAPAVTITVGSSTVTSPPVKAQYTVLTLQPALNAGPGPGWSAATAADLTVHFGLVEVGRVAGAAAVTLAPSDALLLVDVRPPTIPPEPRAFLLVDAEDRGVEVPGALDWTRALITADPGVSWSPDLRLPVRAHGNVVDASRGETVSGEVLGSGDASQANQAFTLTKAPLTYLASPAAANESGVSAALAVWVDGVRWEEVASFFAQPADAHVFVARQDDEDKTTVTFGDGINGSRLPTGQDNVVASYRFGAGAASPSAGSITQVVQPQAGLQGVVNPVAAAGGADAERAEQIRTLAPRSALLLGRAVSIQDMEAAAARVPGVVAAVAEWRWEGRRQRPVVKVWYIGPPGLESTVSRRLRGISDPSTPIDVEVAAPLAPVLSIDVETDERHLATDVARAVEAALLDEHQGLLANERIGIGRALFRSRVFEAVLAVRGAAGVRALLWDGDPWDEGPPAGYGKSPGAGRYFDFESGNLLVSGSAEHA